jgi:hypothetical protein
VIRHVVLARFRDGVSDEEVDAFLDAMRRVWVDGQRSLSCDRAAGLRPGGWDYALVADFDDDDAYRRYDEDPEHRRVREELAPALVLEAARAQLRL